METPIDLIVGLGNPGPKYQWTRHNAGADFVRELAHSVGATLSAETKFFGETARISLNGRDIRLLIPSTYMNCSGQSVSAVAKFYQIASQSILVAHDELDHSPGTVRFKIAGGHGGHNGLRDIIKRLGNSKEFARLRIGVGHPGHADQVADYVLKRASKGDQQLIKNSINDALDSLPLATDGQWEQAMNKLHSN
ncbi:MAG: aminoacyl-tRNA hydrolase [Cellvibrionales bacterium TMED47]|nr:aminoacyl-tRNA hydrolase [Porticoccaceae bacterium]RPG83549.1 MAG: aminoacyl-tRNA hydrolase [Cellvibrionales bacterium TMED47]